VKDKVMDPCQWVHNNNYIYTSTSTTNVVMTNFCKRWAIVVVVDMFCFTHLLQDVKRGSGKVEVEMEVE